MKNSKTFSCSKNIPNAYKESVFWEKLCRQNNSFKEVLISDIDGTIYFNKPKHKINKLYSLLAKLDIPFGYATGRDFSAVILDRDLPKPDLIIAAVGTEIWVKQKDKSYLKDESFEKTLFKNWQREKFYPRIINLIKVSSLINLQERDLPENKILHQPFKISLDFRGSLSQLIKTKKNLSRSLGKEVGIVTSMSHVFNEYCIDLLPRIDGATGKAMPILYLKKVFNQFRSIVAGNGGNDTEMIFQSDSDGIIMNDHSEIMLIVEEFFRFGPRKNQVLKFSTDAKWHLLYLAKKNESGVGVIFKALANKNFNPVFARLIKEELKNEK